MVTTRSVRVVAGVVAGAIISLATAAPTWAQSTTEPSRPDRSERFGGLMERRGRPAGGSGNNANNNSGGSAAASGASAAPNSAATLTDAERKEIEEFFLKNAPRRFEKYQDVPEERKLKLLQTVRGQWRMLQRLKDEDPEVYAIRLKRMPVEDEMFALGWDLRHGDSKTDTRQKLRGKVREFLQSKLDERKLRLSRQEAALQQDQTNIEQLVDRGLNALETERPGDLRDLANPPPLRPRNGNGGAGARTPTGEANNDADDNPPPAVAAQ